MATIHLVSGPIGAGKTTKALAIVRDTKAVLMSPDNWMADSGIPLRHSDIRAVIEEAQWRISRVKQNSCDICFTRDILHGALNHLHF